MYKYIPVNVMHLRGSYAMSFIEIISAKGYDGLTGKFKSDAPIN